MKAELTKRLMQFSKNLVTAAQGLTLSTINRNSVEKCVESGTNAGSEYVQAGAATTKKAFTFKINMCKQQLNAASYRLELITETSKDKKAELEALFTEAKELAAIFNKISRTLKKNANEKKVEEEETEEK
ncbi:MAG: hypothetical protein CO170_01225 [candidate division SR1 bacterium CG_4_9_14_3_um_filter_40_9]|nr:MAG: hypothetical protein CO170_01225 [candidate division SR1 bacterium CG_4_9_14_3_um_filter_40_9]